MMNVLIIGEKSFVGSAVKAWLEEKHPGEYNIDTVDSMHENWKNADFSRYEVVYQVAGIAHIKKETPELRNLFFSINSDLSYEIAKAAKESGVRQYIFMSTKGVYKPFTSKISYETELSPQKLYGKSKLAGEEKLRTLNDASFHVTIIRAPAIYGINAPGSFSDLLSKVDKIRVFPAYRNDRSMIYIKNFAELIHIVIRRSIYGILLPQDMKYVATSDIVRVAAKIKGKKVLFDYITWPFIKLGVYFSKKIRKVFASTVYEHDLGEVKEEEYYIYTLEQAVREMLGENQ